MSVQRQVCDAVKARGYWNLPNRSFAARQLAKLVEEVAELADALAISSPPTWLRALRVAGKLARQAFDSQTLWMDADIDAESAKAEIADVQVVLFCLAETLGLDVAQEALRKSKADVKRGVRDGNH